MRLLINDIYYNVEIAGWGPPLLLLHGFTGSVENWESFFSSWSKQYKVIAVDVTGHGTTDSPEDPKRYDIEEVANDLVSLLDHLNIDRANLLGYSMGGRLALTTAVLHPERINALFLESSSPGLASEEERTERIIKDEALAEDIERYGIGSFVERWEKVPLFSSQQSLPEDDQNVLRKQRLQNNVTGLANSLRGMGTGRQPSVWDRLHMLNMPVVLVVGELDRKFCNIAVKMSERLPDSQMITVPEAGHAIHVEQPRIFDKIVRKDFYQLTKGMKI